MGQRAGPWNFGTRLGRGSVQCIARHLRFVNVLRSPATRDVLVEPYVSPRLHRRAWLFLFFFFSQALVWFARVQMKPARTWETAVSKKKTRPPKDKVAEKEAEGGDGERTPYDSEAHLEHLRSLKQERDKCHHVSLMFLDHLNSHPELRSSDRDEVNDSFNEWMELLGMERPELGDGRRLGFGRVLFEIANFMHVCIVSKGRGIIWIDRSETRRPPAKPVAAAAGAAAASVQGKATGAGNPTKNGGLPQGRKPAVVLPPASQAPDAGVPLRKAVAAGVAGSQQQQQPSQKNAANEVGGQWRKPASQLLFGDREEKEASAVSAAVPVKPEEACAKRKPKPKAAAAVPAAPKAGANASAGATPPLSAAASAAGLPELEECGVCREPNLAYYKFCSTCGEPRVVSATVACGHCGAANLCDYRFCCECGALKTDSVPLVVVPVAAPVRPAASVDSGPPPGFPARPVASPAPAPAPAAQAPLSAGGKSESTAKLASLLEFANVDTPTTRLLMMAFEVRSISDPQTLTEATLSEVCKDVGAKPFVARRIYNAIKEM